MLELGASAHSYLPDDLALGSLVGVGVNEVGRGGVGCVHMRGRTHWGAWWGWGCAINPSHPAPPRT